jgi:hypothetical protein
LVSCFGFTFSGFGQETIPLMAFLVSPDCHPAFAGIFFYAVRFTYLIDRPRRIVNVEF